MRGKYAGRRSLWKRLKKLTIGRKGRAKPKLELRRAFGDDVRIDRRPGWDAATGESAASRDSFAAQISGNSVAMNVGGDLTIRNSGRISGDDDGVAITAVGDVSQEAGSGTDPATTRNTITIDAGGNAGLVTLPRTWMPTAARWRSTSATPAPSPSYPASSPALDERSRVLGQGGNTALRNNVGAIQSSFDERVNFKLDSSHLATESRIFSVEGTGILPPDDQRE